MGGVKSPLSTNSCSARYNNSVERRADSVQERRAIASPAGCGIIRSMRLIRKNRREFIAKMIADLGKAILTVGLASAFFEKFPISL